MKHDAIDAGRQASTRAAWRGRITAPIARSVLGLTATAALLTLALAHPVTRHPAPSATPPLTLTTTEGHPFTLADLRGNAALIYFGYTHCPDVCPMTLAALPAALDHLGPDRARVQVVFVTLDPTHDTPAALASWLAAFHLPAIALTGTPAQTAAAAAAWHIAWRPASNPAFLDHASILTLVAPDGSTSARYNLSELDPDRIAHDLRAALTPG